MGLIGVFLVFDWGFIGVLLGFEGFGLVKVMYAVLHLHPFPWGLIEV